MIEIRRFLTCGILLSALLLGACLDGSSRPRVGSESHFLSTCDDTCAPGLVCICGVCSLPCGSGADCAEFPSFSGCFPVSSALGCEDAFGAAGYCDVECDGDADCWDLGGTHSCDDGVCRSEPFPGDGSDSPSEIVTVNRELADSASREHAVSSPSEPLYPACPTAIALGRTQGSEDDWENRVDINLGATLELDASASKAATGVVTAYEWELVRTPEGSGTKLMPASDTASTTLPLDLAGEYLIALRVFDDLGRESCEPDLVVAFAKGLPQGLHVQAVSSASPAPELHFLHPGGSWGEEPWDCNWRNESPDWGVAESAVDDPWLTREATTSTVVEGVFLREPPGTSESPTTYLFGVYQPARSTQGAEGVLVRVFIDDDLVVENVERALDDQFWLVGSVTWPTGTVDVIDEIVDWSP